MKPIRRDSPSVTRNVSGSSDLGFFTASSFNLRRNKMLKKMLVVVAMSAVAVTAFASDYAANREAKQAINLKDGSIVYVFDGGKMAMESKFGRATRMAPGTTMEAKDGQKVAMVGDEVARLSSLLRSEPGHTSGR